MTYEFYWVYGNKNGKVIKIERSRVVECLISQQHFITKEVQLVRALLSVSDNIGGTLIKMKMKLFQLYNFIILKITNSRSENVDGMER